MPGSVSFLPMSEPPFDQSSDPSRTSARFAQLLVGAKARVKTLAAGIEASLHPARRRKARARIQSVPKGGRLVAVCQGNICRSPYAEAALKRLLRARGAEVVEVCSGGLFDQGQPVPEAALAAAPDLRTELAAHRSRLVTPELVRPGDLVIVMAAPMIGDLVDRLGYRPACFLLGDFDPEGNSGRTIRDPWGQPAEVFDATFRRIDRCLNALVEAWLTP